MQSSLLMPWPCQSRVLRALSRYARAHIRWHCHWLHCSMVSDFRLKNAEWVRTLALHITASMHNYEHEIASISCTFKSFHYNLSYAVLEWKYCKFKCAFIITDNTGKHHLGENRWILILYKLHLRDEANSALDPQELTQRKMISTCHVWYHSIQFTMGSIFEKSINSRRSISFVR